MKFIFGDPPLDPRQAPDAGWRELPSIGAKRIQSAGLLVSCVGMVLVGLLLRGAVSPGSLWTAILILILTVPVHELIHAVTTPGLGFTDRTVIGIQGGKGLLLPYMYYDGSQPAWRMLLTGIAPVLLLSGLPLLVLQVVSVPEAARADLGFLAFFNAAISGGDLVNFLWISTRVPLHGVVKGNGWKLLYLDQNIQGIRQS